MIEILKTKDREVMSLLRLKFALLEQLFLAHLTQSDYAQAVQVSSVRGGGTTFRWALT
jgi:hypothetical protein